MSRDSIDMSPWQRSVYARACEAMDHDHLSHGLLICGPQRLGKRALAERLARRLLCTQRARGEEACGHCRSCVLFDARTAPDTAQVRPDGTPAHPFGLPGHPDAYFIGHEVNEKTGKPRAEIVIDQIRTLSEKLALTPQFGRAQIALVDPAEAINHAACNALLKTLEEPQPGRYLWLISAHPARLPATIRSRCQRLELRLPARDEALAWLRAQGRSEADATQALDAARGHPGLAQAWLAEGTLALRRAVADDLTQLQRGTGAVVEIAQRWVGDEQAGQRLAFAADLALEEASRLTDVRRMRNLAQWFDAANRTRDLLRTTVRADLAVTELLLAWRQTMASGSSATGNERRAK